jgi:hypothetical protein
VKNAGLFLLIIPVMAVMTTFADLPARDAAPGAPGVYQEPKVIEPGVYRVPLVLSPSLEPGRAVLEETVLRAQRRATAFALKNGWEDLMKACYIDHVEIFDRKEDYDRRLLAHLEKDPATKLPASFCAALERRILMAVSPGLFKKVNPKFAEENFYEKVLAHEIIHRLHVRIVADENAMGPLWVFEGFAMYGADQLRESLPSLSRDEIWQVVREKERIDYRKYSSVFRYFAVRASTREIILRAARDDFDEWLKTVDAEGQKP